VKVLLCDDHQLLAQSLGHVLVARGDEVAVTASPEAAVAQARWWLPDVCVMDRMFPSGDEGVRGARDVLAAAPGVKVMMLTGKLDAGGARAAVGSGVRGYVRKDESLRVIIEALDHVAQGMLVVDPAVLRPLPQAGAASPVATLTQREQQVLQRLVQGESSHAIAASMQVTYSTVRTHVQNLLAKLGVHSQLEAAAFAVQHGLVQTRAS
jgi:two-component system, NarL family, nitrate/nitrite response regulator NarL